MARGDGGAAERGPLRCRVRVAAQARSGPHLPPEGRVLMAYAKTVCVSLVGLTGHLVVVEADLANGLPTLLLSGLPDAALSEARDRVRAAIVNSGEAWPPRRITVNLLPAALPKQGSSFDLA